MVAAAEALIVAEAKQLRYSNSLPVVVFEKWYPLAPEQLDSFKASIIHVFEPAAEQQ